MSHVTLIMPAWAILLSQEFSIQRTGGSEVGTAVRDSSVSSHCIHPSNDWKLTYSIYGMNTIWQFWRVFASLAPLLTYLLTRWFEVVRVILSHQQFNRAHKTFHSRFVETVSILYRFRGRGLYLFVEKLHFFPTQYAFGDPVRNHSTGISLRCSVPRLYYYMAACLRDAIAAMTEYQLATNRQRTNTRKGYSIYRAIMLSIAQ